MYNQVVTHTCFGCGKEFVPKRCDAVSCSTGCRAKAQNKKRCVQKKDWATTNKEAVRKSRREYLVKYPERRKKSSAEYMKRNRPYYAEYASLRTRHMKKCCPAWADKEAIQDVYKEAEYLGLEVDHIIPLKHPKVCGLHVWDNLQLLTRSENAQKSNKFCNEDVIAVVT